MLVSLLLLVAFVAVPPTEYVSPSGVTAGTDALELAAAEPPDEELEAIHDRGVTGEGTKIGVVGSSFGSSPQLGDRVADHAVLYDSTDQPRRGATTDHDTKVASVVAGTAPEAELYLSEVGAAPSAETYREAIEWLVDADVDVIVDAGSYAPTDGESRAVFGWAAERASQEDVLFVTSAGNYGNKHWSGQVEGSGWVSFDSTTEANQLGKGSIDGRVSVRLYWEGDDRFDLYLFKHRSDGEDVVVDRDLDAEGAAQIDATVPEGSYYVAIHAPEAVEDGERIRLFSLRQSLSHTEPHGSALQPAATESVLAVGASASDTPLREDSSRLDRMMAGPGTVQTAGGEISGTSASAPYVAGTAALMKSADETLSPAETKEILSSTATQEGEAAVVNPGKAVSAVEPEADIRDRYSGTDTGSDASDR